MYVLHDEWVPRQVGLDRDRFENAWFEGIEKFVVAFCEFDLQFLLKGFVVEDAYSNKYAEELFEVMKGIMYHWLSRTCHHELCGHPGPCSLI